MTTLFESKQRVEFKKSWC